MGLNLDYFYSLSPREFHNVVNGYQKKQDNESKERLIIMRKLFWASLMPHLKEKMTEQQLLPFDFEKDQMEQTKYKDAEEFDAEIEKAREFWNDYDTRMAALGDG